MGIACNLGHGDGQIAHKSGIRLGAESGAVTCPECGQQVAVRPSDGWWNIEAHDKRTVRVLANGVFDCLHPGHVAHLKAARALGDELIVSLTADESVKKGEGRPVFPWKERFNMLAELKCVDAVYLVHSAKQAIELIRPDIYVKGIEYQHNLPEQNMVEDYGGRVVFLDTKPLYSSTAIVTGRLFDDRVRAAREGSK
jgi:rfaE bifunctional protein nucleotidyltransferase chain/domain